MSASNKRLLSLDVFRGLVVFLMLLVNNLGFYEAEAPAQLKHAAWNQGMTLTDLVMPWFLFCMGLSIPLSLQSMRRRGLSEVGIRSRILRRTALIYLIGCCLSSAIARQFTWGLDVLQLIALAYGMAALICVLSERAWLPVAIVLLAGYSGWLLFTPFPGGATGSFEEGHNVAQWLNSRYLDPIRMAGLASVVPTAALALIGAWAMRTFVLDRRMTAWAVAGTICVLVGYGASFAMPYNKAIWTPSYIVMSAGLGLLVLLALEILLQRTREEWTAPILVVGRNAIVAYVLPILFKVLVLRYILIASPEGERVAAHDALLLWLRHGMGVNAGAWIYTSLYIGIWWLVCRELTRRNWLLRA